MRGWRQALKTHAFRLRSKAKHMECTFNKKRSVSNLAVKVEDHIIHKLRGLNILGPEYKTIEKWKGM